MNPSLYMNPSIYIGPSLYINPSPFINSNPYIDLGPHVDHDLGPYYNCTVSFKLHNLTNKKISTGYLIKSIRAKPENKIMSVNINRTNIHLGFVENGLVELKPKETKRIKLQVETRHGYESLRVRAWRKD